MTIKVNYLIYKDVYRFLKRAYMQCMGDTTVRFTWAVLDRIRHGLNEDCVKLIGKWKHPDLIHLIFGCANTKIEWVLYLLHTLPLNKLTKRISIAYPILLTLIEQHYEEVKDKLKGSWFYCDSYNIPPEEVSKIIQKLEINKHNLKDFESLWNILERHSDLEKEIMKLRLESKKLTLGSINISNSIAYEYIKNHSVKEIAERIGYYIQNLTKYAKLYPDIKKKIIRAVFRYYLLKAKKIIKEEGLWDY